MKETAVGGSAAEGDGAAAKPEQGKNGEEENKNMNKDEFELFVYHDEKLLPFVCYLAQVPGNKSAARVVAEPLRDWFYRGLSRGGATADNPKAQDGADTSEHLVNATVNEVPQVRFYLTRPFSRMRTVFMALRAYREKGTKIQLHASILPEILNSDVFAWHCLFQDLCEFDPGVAFSSMKAKRYKRELYSAGFVSAGLLDQLHSGTMLVQQGAILVRG